MFDTATVSIVHYGQLQLVMVKLWLMCWRRCLVKYELKAGWMNGLFAGRSDQCLEGEKQEEKYWSG